ncbi:ATP phosphoribosyltransferase [Gammaproteobacteria bacterium]|nr:ATP phosphoribosyltransferase [Gammaproteobacteria bacterium]
MGLTIALNKGRILDEAIPMLHRCNIVLSEDYKNSRKLIFESIDGGHKIIVVRSSDVPAYVENGIADIGITGKDTILESDSQEGFYELLDLEIGVCRLSIAGLVGVEEPLYDLRVATKFAKTAKSFFEDAGREVSVIKLSGALEIAPVLGLADVIVDIVESGNTLKANGLEEREKLYDISSRLIVNRASMKTKYYEIQKLLGNLREIVGISS